MKQETQKVSAQIVKIEQSKGANQETSRLIQQNNAETEKLCDRISGLEKELKSQID